jgi:hypothetical protein
MSAIPTCVHCLGPLREPGLWSSAWQCPDHGDCHPFFDVPMPSAHALDHVRELAQVPVWVPEPLPPGWCVSAIGWAGDERTGARATAVACCGPAPLGGAAELCFVAEEPGVGLAARLAGLPSALLQAGDGPGDAKVTAARHPSPLWALPDANSECVAYAGEARGVWLAGVFWPAVANVLLIENMLLSDLRDLGSGAQDYPGLVFGAASGRLSRPPHRAQTAPAGARPASAAGP